MVRDTIINLSGKCGSIQVPFGVPVYIGVAELITPRYGVISDLFSLLKSSIVAYELEEALSMNAVDTLVCVEYPDWVLPHVAKSIDMLRPPARGWLPTLRNIRHDQ